MIVNRCDIHKRGWGVFDPAEYEAAMNEPCPWCELDRLKRDAAVERGSDRRKRNNKTEPWAVNG